MTAVNMRNLVLHKRAAAVCRSTTGLLEEGVLCDAAPEDGKLLYRCQSLTCDGKDQSPRDVDLMPLVFPSEDGSGCTRDVCAERWTVLNVEDSSVRSMKKEQAQRRKSGELQIQPFGNCWIKQAMRRKYIEATREL